MIMLIPEKGDENNTIFVKKEQEEERNQNGMMAMTTGDGWRIIETLKPKPSRLKGFVTLITGHPNVRIGYFSQS